MTKRRTDASKLDLTHTLDGLLRGFGSVLEKVSNIAGKAADLQKTGSAGKTDGLHAVYGVSLRVGAAGRAAVARFGNVRQSARKQAVVDEVREPIADLLDEDDYYRVIAELPGVEEPAVQWSVAGLVLSIRAESRDRRYLKRLRLPSAVEAGKTTSLYNNGILELKLWKQAKP